MSLTSLIKNDQELRNKIQSAFLRPKLDKNKTLLVELQTRNHSLVGTAFDYLFRFYLEKLNNIQNQSRGWIAETALMRLSLLNEQEAYEKGLEIINNVKELHKEFIQTGNLSKELIRQTVRMSDLDPVFRAGVGIKSIGRDANPADIEDIEKQLALINEKLFIAKDICLLNPTFGKASSLVGGADADLIIDDKLIDIKTTKKLELKTKDFCQVIGYFLLHRIEGLRETKINQLGIYYSRYGYLFLFNIRDMIDDNSLQAFTEWFENRIRANSPVSKLM